MRVRSPGNDVRVEDLSRGEVGREEAEGAEGDDAVVALRQEGHVLVREARHKLILIS